MSSPAASRGSQTHLVFRASSSTSSSRVGCASALSTRACAFNRSCVLVAIYSSSHYKSIWPNGQIVNPQFAAPFKLPPERSGSGAVDARRLRSEEHTSELQSLRHLVCRLLLEK